MKNKFHGYYTPSPKEFKALWAEALIVVDANVLLNLYTYSSNTWQDILKQLSELDNPLWLPFQFATEYHKNRCGIILKEARQYSTIATEIDKICTALREQKRHPFIAEKKLDDFQAIVDGIKGELAESKASYLKLTSDDPIRDQITALFDGKVGDSFTADELSDIYKEGTTRYDKKIPPGFDDIKKPEPDRYGDLVAWKELLKKAKNDSQSVVLITDDAKKDWWLYSGDEKLSPHPGLLHEFRVETGKDLYIYSTDEFVSYRAKHGAEVSEATVEEIREGVRKRKRALTTKDLLIDVISEKNVDLYGSPAMAALNASLKNSRRLINLYGSEEAVMNALNNPDVTRLYRTPTAEEAFRNALEGNSVLIDPYTTLMAADTQYASNEEPSKPAEEPDGTPIEGEDENP